MEHSFEGMTYREATEYQLKQWVKGISLHNPVNPENWKGDDNGECCPDFSCCQPDLLMPKEIREKFAYAHKFGDSNMKMKILGMALSGLISNNDLSVHIAREDAGSA